MKVLTPVDIQNQTFSEAPLGYAPAEVDPFLEEIASQLDVSFRRIADKANSVFGPVTLTADDIRSSSFASCRRGYDPAEVDAFLERVASQFDEIALKLGEEGAVTAAYPRAQRENSGEGKQAVQVPSHKTDAAVPDYYALLGLDRSAETGDLFEEANRLAVSYAELARYGGAKEGEYRESRELYLAARNAFQSDVTRAVYDAQLDAQNRPQEEQSASDEHSVDWFKETLRHYRSGDLGTARIASDRMRQQYRDDPNAFALSAEILLASGDENDVKQARRFVDEAVVLDTDGAAAYNVHRVRSNVFSVSGDYQKAIDEALLSLKAANPEDRPPMACHLGDLSLRLNTTNHQKDACFYYMMALSELSAACASINADSSESQRVAYDRKFVSAADGWAGIPDECVKTTPSTAQNALDAIGSVIHILDRHKEKIPKRSYVSISKYYQACSEVAKATIAEVERRDIKRKGLLEERDRLLKERGVVQRDMESIGDTRYAPPKPVWSTVITLGTLFLGLVWVAPTMAKASSEWDYLANQVVAVMYLIVLLPPLIVAVRGWMRRSAWESRSSEKERAKERIAEFNKKVSEIEKELGFIFTRMTSAVPVFSEVDAQDDAHAGTVNGVR